MTKGVMRDQLIIGRMVTALRNKLAAMRPESDRVAVFADITRGYCCVCGLELTYINGAPQYDC
jgi:hypothetical protein